MKACMNCSIEFDPGIVGIDFCHDCIQELLRENWEFVKDTIQSEATIKDGYLTFTASVEVISHPVSPKSGHFPSTKVNPGRFRNGITLSIPLESLWMVGRDTDIHKAIPEIRLSNNWRSVKIQCPSCGTRAKQVKE